jgi:hypothetical protein
MGVIFSYLDADDTSADSYTTTAEDETISFGEAIHSLYVTNAGTAAMYIIIQPGEAKIYLGSGDTFKAYGDVVIYSIQVEGAAGQKIRYSGIRG